MERPDSERLDRLPQWARNHIAALHDRVTHLEGQLAPSADTDTHVIDVLDGGRADALPDGAQVRFTLAGQAGRRTADTVTAQVVERRAGERHLELRTGYGVLECRAHSSNVWFVRSVEP